MFEDVLNLASENKEWAFGGIGIFVLGTLGSLVSWLFKYFRAKSDNRHLENVKYDRKSGSYIVPATDEDVRIYDPETAKLLNRLKNPGRGGTLGLDGHIPTRIERSSGSFMDMQLISTLLEKNRFLLKAMTIILFLSAALLFEFYIGLRIYHAQ